MSQIRRTARLKLALSPLVIVAGYLGVVALDTAAARAAEEKPGSRAHPPGVLVEPRPMPREQDSGKAPSDRGRRDERPGCPTNDRPLELLV